MTSAMTVRDAVYDFMRQCGAKKWFGNPGSTELPMIKDFPDDFEYVLGLQEAAVVGMADGYAQIAGNAAFVNLHSAAGVGNAMGNIYTAFKNQTPMVIVAGQQSRSLQPYDPYLNSRRATELPEPYVKWAVEPSRAADVPAAIARAYYTAMQVPRGPVLISVPADDWDAPGIPVQLRAVDAGNAPVFGQVTPIAERVNAAGRVALVVGAAIDREHAWAETIELAERCSAGVFVAPLSARCSFPEDHVQFQGFLPAVREQIRKNLADYDLVFVVGAPAFTYHVAGGGPHVPAGAEMILLTDDAEAATWAPIGSALVCGIKPGLRALNQQLQARQHGRVPRRVAPPEPDAATMSVALLLQTIAGLRTDADIFVEEAPTARVVMHQYLPMLREQSFFTMSSGGLGFAMPAAVGIAVGSPAARVINLIGDGSAMYSPQAIWTATQMQLNVKFVVINNRRYAALKRFAGVLQFPPESKLVGIELPGVDFVHLAAAQGCPAIRIEYADRLRIALEAALDLPGPMLIEVLVP